MVSTGTIVCITFICGAAVVVLAVILQAWFASRVRKCPPDQAMIIYGKEGYKNRDYSIIQGGGRFIYPGQQYAFMPLDTRTVHKTFKNVAVDAKGAREKVKIDAVLIFKISAEGRKMRTAAESLLHKTDKEINEIAMVIIEKNIRAVFRKVTKEAVLTQLDDIIDQVIDTSGTELAGVGMELKSFDIKEIRK